MPLQIWKKRRPIVEDFCVCCRCSQWTATSVRCGRTSDWRLCRKKTRRNFVRASKCWTRSGSRTRTFSTAKDRICTPSPTPTNCSASTQPETLCTRNGDVINFISQSCSTWWRIKSRRWKKTGKRENLLQLSNE